MPVVHILVVVGDQPELSVVHLAAGRDAVTVVLALVESWPVEVASAAAFAACCRTYYGTMDTKERGLVFSNIRVFLVITFLFLIFRS